MFYFRPTTFLAAAITLMCLTYYFRLLDLPFPAPRSHQYDYEVHTLSDSEIDSILAFEATSGAAAKAKHHDSESANRYDVSRSNLS